MSTHALHVILAHQISSEGEEDDQEEERNPNIDAHQPRLFNYDSLLCKLGHMWGFDDSRIPCLGTEPRCRRGFLLDNRAGKLGHSHMRGTFRECQAPHMSGD
jgi:hypothetical protein